MPKIKSLDKSEAIDNFMHTPTKGGASAFNLNMLDSLTNSNNQSNSNSNNSNSSSDKVLNKIEINNHSNDYYNLTDKNNKNDDLIFKNQENSVFKSSNKRNNNNNNINNKSSYQQDDNEIIFRPLIKDDVVDVKNPKLPITFGRDFQMSGGYHSGGAGYLLSSEALKRMATKLINNFTSCRVSGFEDLDVGACWRSVNVTWSKSLDEFKKERFFPQPLLEFYYGGTGIDWLHTYGANKLFRV